MTWRHNAAGKRSRKKKYNIQPFILKYYLYFLRIIRLKRNYGRKFKNHHQRRRNRGHIFPCSLYCQRHQRTTSRSGNPVRRRWRQNGDATRSCCRIPIKDYLLPDSTVRTYWKNVRFFSNWSKPAWHVKSKGFQATCSSRCGGYASGPTLKMAGWWVFRHWYKSRNSYAGVTNKLLAKKACKICVAYDGMERFFEKDKIIPDRKPCPAKDCATIISREEAIRSFRLDPSRKQSIVWGSLGHAPSTTAWWKVWTD